MHCFFSKPVARWCLCLIVELWSDGIKFVDFFKNKNTPVYFNQFEASRKLLYLIIIISYGFEISEQKFKLK